jgi:hypothetical protein
MTFPYPWKPLHDGHLTFLRNENLGFPECDSDVEIIELDSDTIGSPPSGPLSPMSGTDLIRPNPLVNNENNNKRPIPVIKQEFPDPSGNPFGTHIGLTILGNLLVQQRRRNEENLMDCLKQEYERMIQAPTSVSDNLLHPYFRNTNRPWSPGEEPTDSQITLTVMPSFDAVSSDIAQYPCSRCGEMSNDTNFLRRVRGLLPGDWIGPQRIPPVGMFPSPLYGTTAEVQAPYLFFCCLCVFPADPANRRDQELYFWNGHFRPRCNPSAPGASGTPGPNPPNRPVRNWGDSSDSDYHPTPFIPRQAPEPPTPLGATPLPTSYHEHLRDPRSVQFDDNILDTHSFTPAYAAGSQWDYQQENEDPQVMTSKEVSDKHRLIKLVDDVWTKLVPKWEGVYNDTDALALFWQRVRDTMQRETIFEDCVKSGISRPELLHRLLILRLEPTSIVYAHLRPVWHCEEWRNSRLADVPTMIKFLSRVSLNKSALSEAERCYLNFRRHTSPHPEGAVELLIRLRVVYDTACLSPTFENRLPEHTLPETLVRSLDENLHLRVCEGLDRKWLAWRREKMERQERTSPEQVVRTLTKIQQEISTQLQLLKSTTQRPLPRYQPPMNGTRRPNPFRRQIPAALVMTEGQENENVEDPDDQTYLDDALYALGYEPSNGIRSPPIAKPPIGSLGPRVPPTARRTMLTNGSSPDTRQLRDTAKRGQYTLGDPNYTGCHNCADKGHMARDCPKPIQDRIAALVAHETWNTSDALAFIAQGMPKDLEQLWDPEEVRLYCLELLKQEPENDQS